MLRILPYLTCRLLMILLFALLNNTVLAQRKEAERDPDEKIVQDLLEKLVENNDDAVDYTDLQEQLLYYYRHPLNVNTASRDELLSLGLLSELQVNNLLRHRSRYGDLIAIYELQVIDGFESARLQVLQYFISTGNDWTAEQRSLAEMIRKGNHDVFLLFQQVLEKSAGYSNIATTNDLSSRRYLGSPQRYLLRYRFSYGHRISLGLTGEKDAGEQFFSGSNKDGFDFYSAHLFLKNFGRLRCLALGDYQASFGQGLTFASGLGFGKSPFVLNVKRNFQALRPYRSVNENEFLRGAAATYSWGPVDITALISHKKVDGNISYDTAFSEESSFSSIISSGYHRTQAEQNDEKTIQQSIYGSNITLRKDNYSIGFTAIQTEYDKPFRRSAELYNLYAFSGRSLLNTGLDYSFSYRNFSFFGESARNSSAAWAHTHGLLAALDPKVDISLLYRHFDKDYFSTYSNAFAESARNSNEKGLYLGISIRPVPRWTLNAYLDVYKSDWLKYLVDAPSSGHDYLLELLYNPSRAVQMYWRLRQENQEKNVSNNSSPSDYLGLHQRSQFRYHVSCKISPQLTLKSRVEMIRYQSPNTTAEYGTLLFQDIAYKPMNSKLSLIGRLAFFSTDGYNSRIYTFENDLLYQFSIPALQDKGLRSFLLLHYKASRRLEGWLRYSISSYDNRSSIGSGLDEISGSRRSDLKLQLRFSF